MIQFVFRQAVWSTQRIEGGLGWEQESSWRPEDSWVIHSELLLLWQRVGWRLGESELSRAGGP